MNADQVTTNENTITLMRNQEFDEEAIHNLLDKIAKYDVDHPDDNWGNHIIEWARQSFTVALPEGANIDSEDLEFEWA